MGHPAESGLRGGAACSVATARWCADWADGLISTNAPIAHPEQMIDAYRAAGGRGKLHLQVHLSWAPDETEAEATAHEQWRSNVFPPPVCWDIDHAETFDIVSAHVGTDACLDVETFGDGDGDGCGDFRPRRRL